MTNAAKWGGGRRMGVRCTQQTEKGRSDRAEKNASEEREENTSAQFVLECKLRAECRNKIRHLAGIMLNHASG